MHELKIVNKIIEEAKKRRAKSVKIEVGELAEITKEELRENLKVFSGNISIVLKESKVKCTCGYKGRAKILEREHDFCLFNCPNCGKKPNVLEGGEIKIIGLKCA